jgi:hypothetical protein
MKRIDFINALKERCEGEESFIKAHSQDGIAFLKVNSGSGGTAFLKTGSDGTGGINFQHGFAYRMNEGIEGYPLVWLCPPEFVSKRIDETDSYTTYNATVYIHHLNDKYTEDEKEEIWQEQEDLAFSLFKMWNLTGTDIVRLEIMKISPDEFRFKDGTISSQLEIQFELYDCR